MALKLLFAFLFCTSGAGATTTTPAMTIDVNGNIHFGAPATVSTITSGGRLQLHSEDCDIGTPGVIGEVCLNAAHVDSPLSIATATVIGSFVDTILSEVTLPTSGIHISTTNAAETTINTAGTFEKIAGTCTSHSSVGYTVSGCQLTYTDPESHITLVECVGSIITTANNKVFHFRVVRNEAPTSVQSINHSFPVKLGIGADVDSIGFAIELDMDTDDTLDFYVTNITDTTNVTIDALHCTASAL